MPGWVGIVVVGIIVIGNVVGGGMRSITFVQGFQYWLKLTAVAVPALVLAGHFLADQQSVGAPAPPTVATQTSVDVTTDVVVQVAVATDVTVHGRLDDRAVSATSDSARAGTNWGRERRWCCPRDHRSRWWPALPPTAPGGPIRVAVSAARTRCSRCTR